MRPERFPGGMVVWGPLPDAPNLSIMWLGPTTRLYLAFNATRVGGTMIPIEHPSADGAYATEREAKRAVDAFVKADAA